MGEAGLYRCPSCGGEVEEWARSCPFCAAPLATVRCSSCFHMNVPEAVHCSGCGRELGLEPLGTPSELRCPRCAVPLDALPQGAGQLLDCGRCGGQFVEHALLRDLLEQQAVVAERTGAPPSTRVRDDVVRYLPCPSCRALMQRKNFGRSSGVIVDLCPRHGIWFDVGELPRVLAFVAGGGLHRAEARQREEERIAAVRNGLRGPPPVELPAGSGHLDGELVDDLAEVARSLLGYLRGWVR